MNHATCGWASRIPKRLYTLRNSARVPCKLLPTLRLSGHRDVDRDAKRPSWTRVKGVGVGLHSCLLCFSVVLSHTMQCPFYRELQVNNECGRHACNCLLMPMGTVAYRGKGQGKGKGRGEGRLGQGGRGRSKGGEKLMGTTAYGGKGSKGRAANGDRPVGAASCRRDHHTMASCQNPPLTG